MITSPTETSLGVVFSNDFNSEKLGINTGELISYNYSTSSLSNSISKVPAFILSPSFT